MAERMSSTTAATLAFTPGSFCSTTGACFFQHSRLKYQSYAQSPMIWPKPRSFPPIESAMTLTRFVLASAAS